MIGSTWKGMKRDANRHTGFHFGIKPHSVKRREKARDGAWNKIAAKQQKKQKKHNKRKEKLKKTTWLLQGGTQVSHPPFLNLTKFSRAGVAITTRSSARGQANKRPES